MKKSTLLGIVLFTFGISYGQQVLSHSTNNTSFNQLQSIGCGASGNNTDDNIWYRTYRPIDFSFSGDFQVMGAQFFVAFNDISGGAIAHANLRIFISPDTPFPTGTLTEIATQPFTIDIADNGAQFMIILDTPVVVSATDEIIVAIDIPGDIVPFQYNARVEVNSDGQSSPSYISSMSCGIPIPTDFAFLDGGFPNNHVILDLLGDTFLAVEDQLLQDGISIFPNPTQGDITIRFSSNFGPTTIDIISTNGQKVSSTFIEGIGNSTISTSNLATGIYFVQVSTETAKTIVRFIKN